MLAHDFTGNLKSNEQLSNEKKENLTYTFKFSVLLIIDLKDINDSLRMYKND